MSKESRALQLASATEKDHKPKWYVWLALVVFLAMIVWSIIGKDFQPLLFAGLILLLSAGTGAWNYYVNGHIFDDRSGGY